MTLPILPFIPRVPMSAEPIVGSLEASFLGGGDGRSAFLDRGHLVANRHEISWETESLKVIEVSTPPPCMAREEPCSDAPSEIAC